MASRACTFNYSLSSQIPMELTKHMSQNVIQKNNNKTFILKISEKCYQQASNWEEIGKIAETTADTWKKPPSPRFYQCKEKPTCIFAKVWRNLLDQQG